MSVFMNAALERELINRFLLNLHELHFKDGNEHISNTTSLNLFILYSSFVIQKNSVNAVLLTCKANEPLLLHQSFRSCEKYFEIWKNDFGNFKAFRAFTSLNQWYDIFISQDLIIFIKNYYKRDTNFLPRSIA